MLSSNSSLSFSSTTEPTHYHYHHHHHHHHHHPSRPRNHPKSRSKLHHHHHHPSWSSSLSAFSLPQQRERPSGFLIDEYGNEHDPEHCRFKTLATVHQTRRHSPTTTATTTTTSSSTSSRSNNHSLRSSTSSTNTTQSTTQSTHSTLSSTPTSPSLISSPHHLAHSHTLPTPNQRPSCWSSLKTRTKKKKNNNSITHSTNSAPPPTSSWTKSLWAHLRPSPLKPPSPSPTFTYDIHHHATHPIFSIPVVNPNPSPSKLRRKKFIHPSNHSLQLSAIRKRLELVKLQVRFGILRTRKRLLGVWKQQTACKKT